MFRYLFFILIFVFFFKNGFSQSDYRNIKKGIDYYTLENYGNAEASFLKVIENNDTVMQAYYNLGNTEYRQERFEEARENFEKAVTFSKNKNEKAEAYYNIGNTYLAEKKWEDGIDAFKNSLKNNSKDMDAKYNLAFAEKMLAKEQQQQQQDKDQKKDQDKKDDKKDNDKKDQKKDGEKDKEDDKKDGDNKKEDKKDKKKKDGDDKKEEQDKKDKEGKPKPKKLSKEEAERLLRAIESQEQKLQDKKKQEDMTPVRIDTEKDW